MKKGILLTLVLAGWFLINNQPFRQLLFSKNLTEETKVKHLAMAVAQQLFPQSLPVAGKKKAPVPVFMLKQKQFCRQEITIPVPVFKKITNRREQVILPQLPLLINPFCL